VRKGRLRGTVHFLRGEPLRKVGRIQGVYPHSLGVARHERRSSYLDKQNGGCIAFPTPHTSVELAVQFRIAGTFGRRIIRYLHVQFTCFQRLIMRLCHRQRSGPANYFRRCRLSFAHGFLFYASGSRRRQPPRFVYLLPGALDLQSVVSGWAEATQSRVSCRRGTKPRGKSKSY
jgi:hypothetical protein